MKTKENIKIQLKDKKRILYNLRRRTVALSLKDTVILGDTIMIAAELQHNLNHYNYPELNRICNCKFKI